MRKPFIAPSQGHTGLILPSYMVYFLLLWLYEIFCQNPVVILRIIPHVGVFLMYLYEVSSTSFYSAILISFPKFLFSF